MILVLAEVAKNTKTAAERTQNNKTKGSGNMIELDEYRQQLASSVQTLKEAGDSL